MAFTCRWGNRSLCPEEAAVPSREEELKADLFADEELDIDLVADEELDVDID